MSQISDYAVQRLTSILPLAKRQAALSPQLRLLHRVFLRTLVEQGRPMALSEIAALAPGNDAASAIWSLAAADLIVVDPDGVPVGAYPVTIEQTPHRLVVGEETRIRAMCAFDAVAVAPLFDKHVEIRSRCPVTGVEIRVEQQGRKILSASPSREVQIGVWWRNPGAVAARNLCPGIVFLRDREAALAWQAGEVEDHDFAGLDDAIDAATRFFAPLVAEAPPSPMVQAHA